MSVILQKISAKYDETLKLASHLKAKMAHLADKHYRMALFSSFEFSPEGFNPQPKSSTSRTSNAWFFVLFSGKYHFSTKRDFLIPFWNSRWIWTWEILLQGKNCWCLFNLEEICFDWNQKKKSNVRERFFAYAHFQNFNSFPRKTKKIVRKIGIFRIEIIKS